MPKLSTYAIGSAEGDQIRRLSGAIQTVAITTGASPVDFALADYKGWFALVVEVTSGGTADIEVLNFVGDAEPGRTINVVFVSQTDPADVVQVKQNGGGLISCIDNLGNSIGDHFRIVFNQEGNNVVFAFNGDVIPEYRWGCQYGSWDNATDFRNKREPLPTGGTFGQLPYAMNSNGGVEWHLEPPAPPIVPNAGTVASLNSSFPAGSYARGMAVVFDANLPVAGSVVAGSGSSACVVISNGTDYIVMFVFP